MIKRERYIAILMFLSPAVLLYAVFFLLPMAQAFYVALFRWRGVSANKEFVGLANFSQLLTNDDVFWKALTHNLMFLVVSLVIIIPLALFFAVTLAGKLRGAGSYRAIYLFPNIISVVAVGVLWSFVYHPSFGLLNSFLKLIGLESVTRGWLGDPNTALPSIITTSIWYSLGFYIVLLLAGVQSIPRSFYEAASIDGAEGWQSFRHITLPLVWEILKLAIIYLIIHAINVFGLVFVMTDGNPTENTHTLLTYLYDRAFSQSDFGYATAVGVLVFAMIFGIVLGFIRLMRRETVEY